MVRNNDEVALLKATATKGSGSPSEFADRIGDARTYTLMSYALTVAAERKFPQGTEPGAVVEYVAGLKPRYPEAAAILKPTVAEAVLRAALGEPERLAGVDPDDAGVLLFFLTHAILTEAELNALELEKFVEMVFTLADG